MTAEEYKNELKKITKKRGTSPDGWWINWDDIENRKKPLILEVIQKEPKSYKRELDYQIRLKQITDSRYDSDLIPYDKEQSVYVLNVHPHKDSPNYSLYVDTREITEKLKVSVTGDCQISTNGHIYYSVKFDYKPKELMTDHSGESTEITSMHFHVYQEEIIPKA